MTTTKRPPNFHPVRIGIVGLGNFGRIHALTTAAVAEADLVALVDTDEQRLTEIASELPEIPCWNHLEAALAQSNAEAWIVATPTATHVSIAQALLSAGKSVLLEKPVAEDLASAKTLARLIGHNAPHLMLGHVALFNSEFQQLLQEARRRPPIIYINCARHRPTTTIDAFPGESPFHLTMVHDLYLVLVLMNRSEPARMSAQLHRTTEGRCDLAVAQLQWQQGTIASLSASFLTPPGMPSDGFDRMEVFGDGWAARLRPNPRPIEIWDTRARWPLALEIRTDRYAASGMLAEQLRCFCRVVRGIQPVPTGACYQDALQIQRWIEQLANSGEQTSC